jgi:diguanylate cyclase (GGDEF)-like protein
MGWNEKFLIIPPKCPQSLELQLAERMCVEIADLIDSEVGSITMSFGVSEWIKQEKSATLIDRADIALYRAKTSGRNRVELA